MVTITFLTHEAESIIYYLQSHIEVVEEEINDLMNHHSPHGEATVDEFETFFNRIRELLDDRAKMEKLVVQIDVCLEQQT